MINKIKNHKIISILILFIVIVAAAAFLFLPYDKRGCQGNVKLEDGTMLYLPIYCKSYSNFENIQEMLNIHIPY